MIANPSGTQRRLRRLAFLLAAVGMVFGLLWAAERYGTNFVVSASRASAVEDVRAALAAGEPLPPVKGSTAPGSEDPTVMEPVSTQVPAPSAHPNEVPAYSPTPTPAPGEPFAVISFPDLDVTWPVFEGVSPEVLRSGPGHMPSTALPGDPGNAVVSGHRTTWGAPFNRIAELSPGDSVVVETASGTHVYVVTSQFSTLPTDMAVAEPLPGSWLTLTSCHPMGSSRERIITRARLVSGPNVEYVDALWGPVPDPRSGTDI